MPTRFPDSNTTNATQPGHQTGRRTRRCNCDLSASDAAEKPSEVGMGDPLRSPSQNDQNSNQENLPPCTLIAPTRYTSAGLDRRLIPCNPSNPSIPPTEHGQVSLLLAVGA